MTSSAEVYRPEEDDRPNSLLNRTQLRARFEYRKAAANKFAETPSWVAPIPLLYNALAVTTLVDVATEAHNIATEIETLTEVRDLLESPADTERVADEIATITRSLNRVLKRQARLRQHFATQFAENKTQTLPTPAKKARKAAPAKVSDRTRKRQEAKAVVTDEEADKLIAEKWATYESAHAAWKLTTDERGPGVLTGIEIEQHFAQLTADSRAARKIFRAVPLTPPEAKTEARKARDRVIQREIRHKVALVAQREAGHTGFVVPGRGDADKQPAVIRAREKADELYMLAHNFETSIKRQRVRNASTPDAALKVPTKRVRKAKPKSHKAKGVRRGRGGRPLPPLPTPESIAKGNKTKQLRGAEKLLWVPVIMYPTLPADVVLAQTMMDLSNPDRENRPSYEPGDVFYTFWLTHTYQMPLKWKTALNHGNEARYMELKDEAFRRASTQSLEKYGFQREIAPQIAAAMPESLSWYIVQLAATTKYVISERHLPRLFASLTAADFEFRVVEFAGLPVFSEYKPRTPGVGGRAGAVPKATRDTTKPIPPRLIKPGEIGPRTELGNPSSLGMTEAKIAEVLHPKKGIGQLRYTPGPAARAKLSEFVTGRVSTVAARPEESFYTGPSPSAKPAPVAPSILDTTLLPPLPPAEYLTPEPRTA